MVLSVIPLPKSPRIVPGAASEGFVVPIIFLVVATTLSPSMTAATTLPEVMNDTSSSKKGFDL